MYLESHAVDEEGRILEGKPLKQETIQGMVEVLFDERRNAVNIGGLLPPNLLAFDRLPGGHYKMIWYRPAERRNLFFAPQLRLKSGQAWVPPMVYAVERRGLNVYALLKDDRPTDKTKLCHAPFHNVNTAGEVCLGSAKVKKPETKTYLSLMEYWETMFWKSEFTHLAGQESPTKTNLNLLWPRLIKDKKLTWAQLDELKPIKALTLKHFL